MCVCVCVTESVCDTERVGGGLQWEGGAGQFHVSVGGRLSQRSKVSFRSLTSSSPVRHSNHSVDQVSRTISISAPPPTNARGLPGAGNLEMTEEAFFSKMDSELNKIEDFTLAEVTKLRRSIAAVEEELKAANLADKSTVEGIQSKTDRIAGDFLTLEKYVNLNFMGVHKSE